MEAARASGFRRLAADDLAPAADVPPPCVRGDQHGLVGPRRPRVPRCARHRAARTASSAARPVLPSQRLVDGRLPVRLSRVPLSARSASRRSPAVRRPPSPPVRPPARRSTTASSVWSSIQPQATFAVAGNGRAGSGLRVGPDAAFTPTATCAGYDPTTAAGPGRPTSSSKTPDRSSPHCESRAMRPGPTARATRHAGLGRRPGVARDRRSTRRWCARRRARHIAFPFNLALRGRPRGRGRGGGLVRQGPVARVVLRLHRCAQRGRRVGRSRGGRACDTRCAAGRSRAITDERRAGWPAARLARQAGGRSRTLYAYLLEQLLAHQLQGGPGGRVRFRFVLQPHGRSLRRAHRLSAAMDQPLVSARVRRRPPHAAAVPPRRHGGGRAALRPADDGKALLVRIYNPTATPTTARPDGALEREGGDGARAGRKTPGQHRILRSQTLWGGDVGDQENRHSFRPVRSADYRSIRICGPSVSRCVEMRVRM